MEEILKTIKGLELMKYYTENKHFKAEHQKILVDLIFECNAYNQINLKQMERYSLQIVEMFSTENKV